MKKIALLGVLVLSFAATAVADVITFSFIAGPRNSLVASGTGLTAGPAPTITVSDADTGMSFALPGTFTLSTGIATSTSLGPPYMATYSAGGSDSVLILNPSNNPLVAGILSAGGNFSSAYPNGTGSFDGTFSVTFVSPAVLAKFGLGPAVLPDGSVSFTSARGNLSGTTITGRVAGGTVTVETPTIPEPASLGLVGMGFLTIAGTMRVRASRARNR